MIGSFNFFEDINSPASFFDNRNGLFGTNEFIILQYFNNPNNNNNNNHNNERPSPNISTLFQSHNLLESIYLERQQLTNRGMEQQERLIEEEGEQRGKMDLEQGIFQQQQPQQSEQIETDDFLHSQMSISPRRCRVSSIISMRQSSCSSDSEEDNNQSLAFSEQKINLFQACFFLPGDVYLDLSYLTKIIPNGNEYSTSVEIGNASIIEEPQKQSGQKSSALNQWKECFRISKGENNYYYYSLRPTGFKENSIDQIEQYLKNHEQTISTNQQKILSFNIEDSRELLSENFTFLQQLSTFYSQNQQDICLQVDEVLEIATKDSINNQTHNNLDSHTLVDLEELGGLIMKESEESSGSTNSFLFSQVFTTHQSSSRQLQQFIFQGKFVDILHSSDKKKDQLSTSSLLKEGIFDFLSPHSRFLFSKLQVTAAEGENQKLKQNLTLITKDGFKLPSLVSVSVKKIQIDDDTISFFIFNFKVKIKHQKCLAKLRKGNKHSDKEDQIENTSNQAQVTMNSGKKRRKFSDNTNSSPIIDDEFQQQHLEQNFILNQSPEFFQYLIKKNYQKRSLIE